MQTNLKNEYFDLNNVEFYEEYFNLLINRVTHSSMSLEPDLGNPDDSTNAIRLRDSMRAFKILIDYFFSCMPITEDLIIQVANMINDGSLYISNGYRKIDSAYIADTNIPIVSSKDIPVKMFELLTKYKTEWKNLDPFEREAKFHIEFIRIHPFEDGNGRTSRLLLNFNLLIQGKAPVIITNDLLEYYRNCIQNYDIDNLKRIFEIQSYQEKNIIEQLYTDYLNKKRVIDTKKRY